MTRLKSWIGRIGLGLPISFLFLGPVAELLNWPGIGFWDRLVAIGCAAAGMISAFWCGRLGR